MAILRENYTLMESWMIPNEKDFYLTKAWFRGVNDYPEAYRKIDADGILLNFSDVDWMQVKKMNNPQKINDCTE